MIKKILILSNLILITKLFCSQVQIPLNSTDKTSINKWIIAKANDSIDTKKLINSEDYFSSIEKENLKSLNLSKFNNITFSLYQIFEEINFNNTFIIASNIESKIESRYSFILNSVDMSSEVYVNGQKVKLPYGLYNLKFEHILNKGKNRIVIIGKPKGNYKPSFSLKINDNKLSKIKIKVLDKNFNPHSNGYFSIKSSKMNQFFQLDENGEYEISVITGKYRIYSSNGEFFRWSEQISLSENQSSSIKLILDQKSKISGKVTTIGKKTPHPGIKVSLVDAKSKVVFWTSTTNNSGDFNLTPPNGNWNIKIHRKQGDKYYAENDKEISVFNIDNNSNSFGEINFEIPTQINTSWGRVTMFDGILSNSMLKTLLSKKDILYFATFNGLSVYDGLTVKNYNYLNGLPNDPISVIFEDKDEFIWLGFRTQGLIKWQNGKVIKHYKRENGLKSNTVSAINQDKNGKILVGTKSGFSVLENNLFSNYNFTKGIGNGAVNCITVIGNNIWIGTSNGLSIYNDGIIKPIEIETYNNETWRGNNITVIKKDDNNVWLGTYGGLIKYDGIKFKFYSKKDGLPNDLIQDIYVDNDGLLIATRGALCKMEGDIFSDIISLDEDGLKNNANVRSINKTKDGMYFISTNMQGVFYFDPKSINTITSNEGFKEFETINDIKIDKNGSIWAGGQKGLYKIENGIVIKNFNSSNSDLPINVILDIEFDNDGSMWLCQNNFITRFNENKFEDYSSIIKDFKTQVKDIEFDNDGTMWLGTTIGLGKFKNDSLTIYRESDGLVRPLSTGTITAEPCAITIGKNNEVIYSTYGSGFSIFNGEFFTNFSTQNGLANNRVEEIAVDSKNNYWIALDGSGVQMYNGEKFKHYTMENGLSSDESYTIYVDDFDKVFVGSWHGGVNYFDGKLWNSLDSRDGLLNNTVKCLHGLNGDKYWFGGYGGITSYEPKIQTPSINISSIETPNGFYSSLEDIKSSNQKFIYDTRTKITLNSTSFNTKKEKQKYFVKVKRKKNVESLVINSNEYVFNPSKHGKYTIEFQSIDRDMNYSNPLKFEITVVGPWYKNLATAIPFWGFLLLLISLTTYSSKKYLNQRRYTAQLKEESRLRLEEKNKEIVDSINYAKRIQDAMMTSEGYRKSVIPKSFIFFKPKDVVSGDFYWVFKDQEENIFFTVADCTGHGVPGAFMSMIGTSLLNEIIVEKGIKKTNDILDEMRKQIIKSLNQADNDDQKDGMDISICKLNLKKNSLEFSGAHNPLLVVSKGEIKTYKGDSQAVGLETENIKPFTKHSVNIEKNDMIYIYSDGYQDQFGGENGKKYMAANFKKFLLKISKEEEKKQNKLLEIELANWMKNEEQIDDICIMGVRV